MTTHTKISLVNIGLLITMMIIDQIWGLTLNARVTKLENQVIDGLILTPELEIITPTPKATPSAAPKPVLPNVKRSVEGNSTHSGLASYYSRSGCVGCSPTMTMANGEPLDDSRLTVAFNRAKLNSKVRITNVKTGQSVVATVTDRGGFEAAKYNHNGKQRIVDLTIATRDAIDCSNLCDVEVQSL